MEIDKKTYNTLELLYSYGNNLNKERIIKILNKIDATESDLISFIKENSIIGNSDRDEALKEFAEIFEYTNRPENNSKD